MFQHITKAEMVVVDGSGDVYVLGQKIQTGGLLIVVE